jgi:hypothetical protein
VPSRGPDRGADGRAGEHAVSRVLVLNAADQPAERPAERSARDHALDALRAFGLVGVLLGLVGGRRGSGCLGISHRGLRHRPRA